ncbi:MAG: hypothetical protein ACRENP_16250 [Longimicrobiales bacterium]
MTGFVSCDRQQNRAERRIVTEHWDTIFQIGGFDPNDTTLVDPGELVLWDSLLVSEDDGSPESVRAFSLSGEALWTFGRPGSGPGELSTITTLAVGPDGLLWVFDSRNRKVVKLDQLGRLQSEQVINLGAFPSQVAATAQTVVMTTQTARMGLILTDAHLGVLGRSRTPWPDSVTDAHNLQAHVGAAPGRPIWVIAYQYGPGFVIGDSKSWKAYRYIDPIYFALKSGPRERTAGADTALYGARSLNVIGDEIFMLFGGRPNRFSRPGALPTELVDVYGLDGTYRRSLKLPSDTPSMVTDGETFYVLTRTEEGLPTILALRPKVRPLNHG